MQYDIHSEKITNTSKFTYSITIYTYHSFCVCAYESLILLKINSQQFSVLNKILVSSVLTLDLLRLGLSIYVTANLNSLTYTLPFPTLPRSLYPPLKSVFYLLDTINNYIPIIFFTEQ
jgi:hypothetical protein